MSFTAPSHSLLHRGWARGLDLRALAESALDSGPEDLAGHPPEDEETGKNDGKTLCADDSNGMEEVVPG